MRIFICFLIFGGLVVSPVSAQLMNDSEKAEIQKTTKLFLDSLFMGDVPTLKAHIAGNLLKRMKTLLDDNKEYSKILRKRYANAFYQTDDPVIDKNRASVNVSIEFPNSKTHYFQVKLEKINKLKWMVTDQIEMFTINE